MLPYRTAVIQAVCRACLKTTKQGLHVSESWCGDEYGKSGDRVKVSSVNKETGETVFTEKVVLTEQPCRLSFSSRNSSAKDDGYNTVSQSVVLFIAPEIEIPSGSKITVTQNGKTTDYCRSGESAVYTSHQEIALELFEDYA